MAVRSLMISAQSGLFYEPNCYKYSICHMTFAYKIKYIMTPETFFCSLKEELTTININENISIYFFNNYKSLKCLNILPRLITIESLIVI